MDGSPIAWIANYAMHGTALSGRFLEVSGDAPGIVSSYLESKLGAPVLYVNGAAGNLAPIYTVQPDPRAAHLGEFRVLLGDRILEANRAMGAGAEARLWLGEKWIETQRKAGLGWTPELPAYASKTAAGVELARIPVRFLRIGDAVAWAAPVELFCEISMRVREGSPWRHTFFFGYANGWLGYLPTAAAFAEGGYEPRTSVFTEQVEKDFTEGVLTFLDTIPRER
jgi:hypothetical protein